MYFRRLLGIAVSIALLGCAGTGQDHERARLTAPAQLGLSAAPDANWPDAQWWRSFNDPQLDQLIALARAGNPNLRIAQARIELANAQAQGTRADNQPALALDIDTSRERYSENDIYPPPLAGKVQNHGRAVLDFSYEFDFWGRQRAALAAALSEVQVAQAEHSATELMLSVAVAQSYLALQHALAEQELTAAVAKQQAALLTLIRERVERGLASRAEADPVEAAAANARRDVASAQQLVDVEHNRLAALCGMSAAQLPPLTRNQRAVVDAEPPHYIPADLLGRRADIVAQRLRAETESSEIAVAEADFYPNVNLTAFFGVQSVYTGVLLNSDSRVWGVGPALHLPLFNRDVLRAQLRSRRAAYDIAVEEYNQSVLNAVRETADAGATLRALARESAEIDTALQALQRARAAALLREQRGLANRLDVVNAELAWLDQQRKAIGVDADRTQAQLLLIKALGGGYAETQTH